MAARGRAKAKVEEEVAEETEKDFSVYLEKDPTPKQERFIDWILRETGYEPENEDDFRLGAQLGQVLYMYYQRSDENQAILEQQRAEREAAKANPKPKRGRGRPKAEEADEVDESDEDAPEETPAPRRRAGRAKAGATTRAAAKPAAKAGATKTAAKPRARRAAKPKADAGGTAAPF